MNRKHIILTLACILFVAMLLIALYAFSPLSKDLTPSSFSRSFAIMEPLHETEFTVQFDKKNYYIAGITDNTVWLGNSRKPFTLTRVDLSIRKSHEFNIELVGVDSLLKPKSFKTKIDSPNFYLSNGVMPIILRGNLGNWKAKTFISYDNYYFADAEPIAPSKFALTAYSQYQQAIQIGLLNAVDTPHFQFNFNLLKKQREGVFSVHGSTHYIHALNKIVYIYTYRNQYIVMDTTLQELYSGNTIDTFSVAPIRVRNTDGKGTFMLASPPIIVNGQSCVSEKYLYIRSNLLAINEDREKFLKSSTIDVYDLELTKYIHSFHIPAYKNKEISDFKVHKKNIYAIYDNHIIKYKLN